MPLKQGMQPSLTDPKIKNRVYAFLLLAGTLLLYAPVLFFQFIYYDDNAYVFENTQVLSGLSADFFKWFLTANVTGNWHPLTMLSHAADAQLYGTWAGGHHFTSVLFHALNAVLVFLFFLKTTRAPFKAFLIAALFAWHPIKVESVAWVSERKDVLSTFFALLAMLAYAKNSPRSTDHGPRFFMDMARGSWLVALSFTLSLLCKPMYVTLPLILLFFDFWPLGRKSEGLIRLFFEKVPLIFLSFIFSLIALRYQAESKAIQHFTDFALPVKIANLTQAYWDYLTLFVWPAKLSVFYPYIPNSHVPLSLGLGLILAAATFLLFKNRAHAPALWVGWCIFGVCLLPVIGIVKLGAHWIACRYLYWPAVGLSLILVWGGEALAEKLRISKKVMGAIILILIAGYAFTASVYLGKWQNSYILFSHAEKTIPHNWVAHINLRAAYGRDGNHAKAAEHYLEAIKIFPGVLQKVTPHWLDFYYMGKNEWHKGKIPQGESFLKEAARLIGELNSKSLHPDTRDERELLKICLESARTKTPAACPFTAPSSQS